MRKTLKVLAVTAVALLAIAAALVVVIYARSNAALEKRYPGEQPALSVPSDSVGLERGRHLVEGVLGCKECHGADYGGTLLIDSRAFMRLPAPNLTRGIGAAKPPLREQDWALAIRHGVGPAGRALAVMPSTAYQHLGDADLGAAIAYLHRLPPTNRVLPERTVGPIARSLIALGRLPLFAAERIDHAAVHSVGSPQPGVTIQYGHYLADIAGCTDCHGPGLSGGKVGAAPPDAPPASNITRAGIGSWTERDFQRALRQGIGSGGRRLNQLMPYRSLQLTDDEIRALWLFVRSLPPRPFGNR